MSAPAVLKAAVIGLGRMGMHHVRACVDTAGVDLVAILDHKPDWAVKVGAETQSLVAADLESLIGKVDFAIVAVPTADHASTAIPLLDHGIACLVEKPIAGTAEDAEAMIAAATRGGTHLQVGHIERFNPALDTLTAVLESAEPVRRILAQRHNLPDGRAYDVDVVLDLMIHDLDLLTLFAGNQPESIAIEGPSDEHYVEAHLAYATDMHVVLSVNRQATQPARTMRVETNGGTYVIDYSTQTVHRLSSTGSEPVPVTSADALRRQLVSFARTIRSGSVTGASGEDGLRALRLANRVRARAGLI